MILGSRFRLWLAMLLLPVWTGLMSFTAFASVPLLMYDDGDSASVLDCAGTAAALDELGMYYQTSDLAAQSLNQALIEERQVLVACHLSLGESERVVLSDWIAAGGGLLATGQSAWALEAVFGIDDLEEVGGDAYTEIRFFQDHPVTTGSWWDGPIMHSPPMPAPEVPSIMRYLYIDNTWPDGWPAHAATATTATSLAGWRDSDAAWNSPLGPDAVFAHTHGNGRVIYSGPLPGVYANWDWPRTWRTFITSSVHWLAEQAPLVEIGLWPDGHRAALSWTGDTERPAMVTAVPALLDVFADLGLERFGTFYMVGRSGGDEDTLGALEHPEVVQAIAAAGSQVGGHGNVHTSFAGQSLVEQTQRLAEMVNLIDPLLEPYGERVRGFRAPYLSQDWTTFQALDQAGLDYDAGEADVWSEVTLPHPLGPVWQLPPTMPMDWHLFEVHDLDTAAALTLFVDKLDYVVSRRGLFSWLHHPWVIEPHIDLVRDLLTEAIARGDIWMARQDDILDWWVARELIEITAVEWSGTRLRVQVSNTADVALAGVTVWIRVPHGEHVPWFMRHNGQVLALASLDHAGQTFRLAVLDPLPAGTQQWLEFVPGDGIHADRFEQVVSLQILKESPP